MVLSLIIIGTMSLIPKIPISSTMSLIPKKMSLIPNSVTVPTCCDIGEAAADAEGVRSLAVVAAVQMLDITGGVHIRELVATVRGRTLETGPGGWKWWWRGGVSRRTARRQWSWGRSVRVIIIRGGGS